MKNEKPTRNYVINFLQDFLKLPFSTCRRVLKEEHWNSFDAYFRLMAIKEDELKEMYKKWLS